MKRQWKIVICLSMLLFFLSAMEIGCTHPTITKATSDNRASSEVRLTSMPGPPLPLNNDKATIALTVQVDTPIPTPAAGQLTFTSATITPSIPAIFQAYADGDRLFFSAQDLKNLDPIQKKSFSIYLQNLRTGETTLLSTSPYGADGRICCMRASENWLTWLTNRSSGSGWLVVAKHMPDGQEIILDRDEDTGVKTLRGPFTAISGNQFVWVSTRKLSDGVVKTYLILVNLSTGEKRTLAEASMPESLVYVDIDGQWVVWSKGSSAGGVQKSNVYLLNLSTAEQTQLSDDDQSHQPVIKGDWISWRTGFGDIGPIVVFDRRTGERTTLSMKGDFLRMGDGLLLWWTYAAPFAYVYDLRSHTMDSFDRKGGNFDPPMYITGRMVAFVSSPEPKTLRNSIFIRTYLP